RGREPRCRRHRRIVSRGRGGPVPVTDLLSLTPDAARAAVTPWLAARNEATYRAKQIMARLWRRPVASWAEAPDLPAALRRGFRRNLAPAEIAGQVRELLLSAAGQAPTNVVFMGMGEPLLNWEAVDASLTILNHPDGFGIGARHITVSTVGILANLAQLARRPEQFRLALSLHAPTPALRLALMPIEKKYALPDVVQALQQFRRRV